MMSVNPGPQQYMAIVHKQLKAIAGAVARAKDRVHPAR